VSYPERATQAISIAPVSARNPGLARVLGERGLAFAGGKAADPAAAAEDLAAPNCLVLLARAGTEPVGCVALVDQIRFGEISRLYVAASARGMGIGRGLLREAEYLSAELGLRLLRLWLAPGRAAARSLCCSMGWQDCDPVGVTGTQTDTVRHWLEKRLF
jgi:putative acetyltransferase